MEKTFVFEFKKDNFNWSDSPGVNLLFLRMQQRFFREMQLCNGYVFVTDVCNALNLPKTEEGQTCGWFIKNGSVNFGIDEVSPDLITLEFTTITDLHTIAFK